MAQGRKATCDNCGGDHNKSDCAVPRDEAKTKKRKDDRAARQAKAQQGRGGVADMVEALEDSARSGETIIIIMMVTITTEMVQECSNVATR